MRDWNLELMEDNTKYTTQLGDFAAVHPNVFFIRVPAVVKGLSAKHVAAPQTPADLLGHVLVALHLASPEADALENNITIPFVVGQVNELCAGTNIWATGHPSNRPRGGTEQEARQALARIVKLNVAEAEECVIVS